MTSRAAAVAGSSRRRRAARGSGGGAWRGNLPGWRLRARPRWSASRSGRWRPSCSPPATCVRPSCPRAGMIGCSLAHRGEELLVQRGGLGAWRGTGKSFGLPLLHPWANRLRDWRYAAAGRVGADRRTAGRARRRARPADPRRARGGRRLGRARRRGGRRPRAGWRRRSTTGAATTGWRVPVPAPAGARAAPRGAGLTVATSSRRRATGPVPLAFGWHPWLALPGVPRAEWELELPAREVIALDDRGLPTGERSGAQRSAPRSATACSTTTRGWRRTPVRPRAAAGARSRSSGRAATATRRSSRRPSSTSPAWSR